MIEPKVAILGFLISIAFTFDTVGIFTSAWVTDPKVFYSYKYLGIVPLPAKGPFWVMIASWLLFLSFACFILMAISYIVLFKKLTKSDLSSEHRKWLAVIAVCSGIITTFTIASVAWIVFNCYKFGNQLEPGFSAWLCVIAAILSIGCFNLTTSINRNDLGGKSCGFS